MTEPLQQIFLDVNTINSRRLPEIVATTSFVRSSDVNEIVSWFSGTETSVIVQYQPINLFFHPLPSGDHA
ncbi:MAG: hypothetical protein ACRCUY_11275, partial [Thermoguttaceae bacterium]